MKGAPEYLIKSCRYMMTEEGVEELMDREKIMGEVERMAEKGLRVIAVGYKSHEMIENLREYCPAEKTPEKVHQMMKGEEYELLEQEGVLVGLVGIMDKAREEVPEAIAKCQRAGINVIMITGDNQKTAQSIAATVGIIGKDDDHLVYTGLQLQNMNSQME